ncbi:MAG: PHB depolymerase family esterase [Defluviicoccus sp.]
MRSPWRSPEKRRRAGPVSAAIVLTTALSLNAGSVVAADISLTELGPTLAIDPTQVSVSGVSSGGFMAHQFHVAYAAGVIGAGVIAGGPYDCAGERSSLTWFDPTGLFASLYVCSALNPLGLFLGPPDVKRALGRVRSEAEAGRIDDPANLARARAYLFSGANDRKVPGPVVASLEQFYRAFMEPGAVYFEQHPVANHAMITENFGNACAAAGPPFVNDCDLSAAAALLQQIYGPEPLQPPAKAIAPALRFDQRPFFDPADASISLHAGGHVYVPAACRQGTRCRLHVAFHGCLQSEDEIGDAFYAGAGYNEIAESNAIVVLYPQVTAWADRWLFQYRQNPRGCWDWWGYSGADYARKSGKQMQAVAAMIAALTGSK